MHIARKDMHVNKNESDTHKLDIWLIDEPTTLLVWMNIIYHLIVTEYCILIQNLGTLMLGAVLQVITLPRPTLTSD